MSLTETIHILLWAFTALGLSDWQLAFVSSLMINQTGTLKSMGEQLRVPRITYISHRGIIRLARL